MVVGAARHQTQAAIDKTVGHRCAVLHHGVDVRLEFGLKSLAQCNGLACNHVHERAALAAREHRGVDFLRESLVIGENEAAARAAQGLMRGSGHDVGIRHGRRMRARSDEAGDVGHVDHQKRAVVVRDARHALKIDHARIGARAAHDKLGMELLRHALDGVVVDTLILAQAIRMEVVQLAREVRRRTMRKVAAIVEAHAKHDIARLDSCEICRQIGISARVGLHIGELGTEQFLRSIACEVFDDIDLLAAAVIALARIAFRIFIGEHAAHSLHDGRTGEILRCDKLDGIALAIELFGNCLDHLRVLFGEQRHAVSFV